MKIRLVASLLLAFGYASTVQAQPCRIGSGPDFGDGIPYCSELSSDEDTPEQVPETPQWSTRWGAIAIDPKVAQGGVGVASDMESRVSAEAVAMTACRDTGGGESCRVEVSYDNQCAVIAWGDHYYVTANAETVGEASRIGLNGCGRRTENCRIVYSNCSYPVRLR
ncbi:MAG: hypothetical protein BGO05_28240 [Rhizobiales bacterium 63-7]|nr:MAG: hypothetical protein BGO05_28240 [Rhizobiales bacterium 63-7]